MSLQFGFFARLTWWEYSWDIMEPVTYFVGYGTSVLIFAYFVLTRQVRVGGREGGRNCVGEREGRRERESGEKWQGRGKGEGVCTCMSAGGGERVRQHVVKTYHSLSSSGL